MSQYPLVSTALTKILPWPSPQILEDASWASAFSSPGPEPSASLPQSPQGTSGNLRHLHWVAKRASMEHDQVIT